MVKILKAMTYNIFTGKFRIDEKRIQNQIEQLLSFDCDIICLQEMWDRKVIDIYKKSLQDKYDIVTCNSNMKEDEHSTLLLARGGFCQRMCELILPVIAISGGISIIITYFLSSLFKPEIYTIFIFIITALGSISIAIFGASILKYFWTLCKLPQHGFINGDILGLMILVRKGENSSGADVRFIMGSAFAEVFNMQAAKSKWRLFGFVERFFIVKGYLTIDVSVDGRPLGVTNIHLNTGTRNKLRMEQIRELFSKAIPSNQPAILCGDTNAEDIQPEIQWISSRMVDTYAVKRDRERRRSSRGDGFTWHEDNPLTHQGFLVDRNMRIDFLWFRNKARDEEDTEEISEPMTSEQEGYFEVKDSSVVMDQTPITSDHFGVLTEFKINEA